MHPVLKSALEPLAKEMSMLSLDEAQVAPLPGQGRWCAQQVMEHLILTYQITLNAVNRQLKTGRTPKNRRSVLEFFLRVQTLGLGYMPDGVPAIRSVRPTEFVPEVGAATAARFLKAAEEMDHALVAARKKFGIQACGVHPLFGVMRVDEWRRYHAVHASHHATQLQNVIRYVRAQKTIPAVAPSPVSV